MWYCECDCGGSKYVSSSDINRKAVKSCGCLRRETAVAHGRTAIKKTHTKEAAEKSNRTRGLGDGTMVAALTTKVRNDNKIGIKGISFEEHHDKYSVRITFKSVTHWLGRFDNLDEAIEARRQAEERIFAPVIEKHEREMELMKNNDLITVSRDDLKAEMLTALSDIISDGVKNIGDMLTTALSGNRQPAALPPPPPPQKDELLKIVSGYLYMALGDLKYERKDIMPILQRIEKYMRVNNYEEALTAYQNAEDEFLAMLEQTVPVAVTAKIAGIEIPAQFHDFSIEQLIYTSNISKGKTAKGLRSKGITHIRDFFKTENSDLNAILSVKGKKSFIDALERTIASANSRNKPYLTVSD
jgi:hypothetical protein